MVTFRFTPAFCLILATFNLHSLSLGSLQEHKLPLVSNAQPVDSRCCYAANVPESSVERPKNMAFLIGAQKSGTTFLFDELVSRHPRIKAQTLRKDRKLRINGAKEPHFFHKIPLKSFSSYLYSYSKVTDEETAMDATPDYMHIPSAACRIAASFPGAKIIAVLRDPVMRAFSQWNMMKIIQGSGRLKDFDVEVEREIKNLRNEGCSFEKFDINGHEGVERGGTVARVERSQKGKIALESVERPKTSWNDCFKCFFFSCGTYRGPANTSEGEDVSSSCRYDFSGEGLVRRGLYVHQLKWWLELFPEDQMMVINHEQLKNDPERVLDDVIAFLSQDVALKTSMKEISQDNTLVNVSESNVNAAFIHKEASGWSLPISEEHALEKYAETLRFLYSFYEDANKELYQLMAQWGTSSGWKGSFPQSYIL
ncbi:hypothetical protein CEUSTIGMA_g5573.t1 [Chlamydomonas eustigma]|uniref:Sulfotransferase n=1 Tax=Chlamydomonas eustigma TaxID=1157962 RepID=A0A250X4Y6_9CHLO|nr:hypothetical protein CEUSTIGMA_g5573.t1 [Chlamydomonas eustigma]|eukprot:GAX78131.1 hypothetical protein CEUSTIGMA_g5573.t1 [Chlamydomonas eustigma]